tara:strand:+ start:512 stop:1570 length:1059 start_codon:yes stop_codon:yes gene_type:complete
MDKTFENNIHDHTLKTIKRNRNVYESLDQVVGRNPEYADSMKYIPRNHRPSTTLHLGQLKLFLSTLQFLLKYAPIDEEVHVVYPGSAPGNNIELLSHMFPQCRWYLYDPRTFYTKLHANPKVLEIQKTLFTDAIVSRLKKQLQDKYVLLISDIRVFPTEEGIIRDNDLQAGWVKALRPNYSQLKFRIPRVEGTNVYNYLDGKVYLQMFASQATTETRLVVPKRKGPFKMIKYGVEEYEGAMYFFNRSLRCSCYPTHYSTGKVDSEPPYTDHCHDCVSMLKLISEYIERYAKNFDIKFERVIDNRVVEHALTKMTTRRLTNFIFETVHSGKRTVSERFLNHNRVIRAGLKKCT